MWRGSIRSKYANLEPVSKIIRSVNEYYYLTQGHWDDHEMHYFRSALMEIGMDQKVPLQANQFFEAILQDRSQIDKLFEGIGSENIMPIPPQQRFYQPLLKGLELVQEHENMNLETLTHSLRDELEMDSGAELNALDFASDLLASRRMADRRKNAWTGEKQQTLRERYLEQLQACAQICEQHHLEATFLKKNKSSQRGNRPFCHHRPSDG
ncbi:hypothetical protein WDW89_06925 [Deltaproteobacteria bacterium TL4]